MKLTRTITFKGALVMGLFAGALALNSCAVRVAPAARGPVVVQKHRCYRTCRLHHPRRVAPRRNIVVIRR